MASSVSIISKLSNTPTTIFTVMSRLAGEHGAINLSQGFPDFEISAELISLVNKYMKKGCNQYAPMQGVPALRSAISEKVRKSYGVIFDPETEITITAGGTQGLFTAIAAFIREGDEVIVFDPAYDSYDPAVRLCGGTVKHYEMKYPDFQIDWREVQKLVTGSTRMIIINTPHNPSGSILRTKDMKSLEKLTSKTDILVLSDEVYEHLIFDGESHQSLCRYPDLQKRSLVVYSFGKTFHATGWKIGYVLAPEYLMHEFRKVHQFNVFTCNTPIQYALADFLTERNYEGLGIFYQQKRDLFLEGIKSSRFKIIPSFGTYFQVLEYNAITDEHDMDFARSLTIEKGVASIPLSAFYKGGMDHHMLRFCFAKKEETLKKAAKILCTI
ncbi:MAG: aminotransferase class I/II-fold pyridoxal phosphate-dependent enzyme [Bacteroidetes bacterium]|nr:aminotransferase class I/II-fold pyridoxal phosphate-dependent enzyme [Bacteroidota bacterium]